MEWLINRRRMMYNRATTPAYIPFEDEGIWRICCENFGDYNETVITAGDSENTVNIVESFVSKNNTSERKRIVLNTQTNVDNSGGIYTIGTTKEAVGITIKQCKAVSSNNVSTLFSQNITVSGFQEFQYFTGVTTTYNEMFQTMTIAGTIILPPSITYLHDYTFRNLNVHKIVLSEGITSPNWSWRVFYYCNAEEIVFPSTITTINNLWNGGTVRRNIIINTNAVVPVSTQSYLKTTSPLYIYVKDELVDAFKADESWSTNIGASKIYPISEYVES